MPNYPYLVSIGARPKESRNERRLVNIDGCIYTGGLRVVILTNGADAENLQGLYYYRATAKIFNLIGDCFIQRSKLKS